MKKRTFVTIGAPAALRRVATALLLTTGLLTMGGTGCVSLRFITVDQQTALEAQILGSFAELESDLTLAASSRGGAEPGADLSAEERKALNATMNRRYNQDDLLKLKDNGCVAEQRDGMVTARPCAAAGDETVARLQEKVVREENRDRNVLLRYVVHRSVDLSEDDLPKVAGIFARLQYEQAADAHLLQAENGSFVPKKSLQP